MLGSMATFTSMYNICFFVCVSIDTPLCVNERLCKRNP